MARGSYIIPNVVSGITTSKLAVENVLCVLMSALLSQHYYYTRDCSCTIYVVHLHV